MGGGPSLEEKLKQDTEYMKFVQQQQKVLTDTQGQNYLKIIESVDKLLNQSVADTIDQEKDVENVSKAELDKAKEKLVEKKKEVKADPSKADNSGELKNPAENHTPNPGTLVLLNIFDCIYNSENKSTFSWLGNAVNTLVQDITGVATMAKEGKDKVKDSEEAKKTGANLENGSEDLLNTFSSVFGSSDSVSMIASGISGCLKQIMSSFDSTTTTTLHMNKTVRFIAPGAYIGVYVCNASYNFKGSFHSTSYKLSCYGLYMATSLSLMKELEKLDTMRKVFGFYKHQLEIFDKQSSNISSIMGDCANVHRQIGKFSAYRVKKLERRLHTDYLKKWLGDIVEQLHDAIESGDCDKKEATEFFNESIGYLKDDIQYLKDARADTYETLQKYVQQLEKLAKI